MQQDIPNRKIMKEEPKEASIEDKRLGEPHFKSTMPRTPLHK